MFEKGRKNKGRRPFRRGRLLMRTIAVVEDDVHIGNMLAELLTANGYAVLRAFSGSEAALLLEKERPDLVILDLMLPGMSGEEVLARIAGLCPVIILSAKTDVRGKVRNLNAGAVDYVTKPFDNDELLARIGVHLRRGHDRAPLSLGGIRMDFDTFEVFAEGKPVRLTKTEFAILRTFLENPRKVFSRSAILDYIEGFVPDGEESSVGVHISNLRRKLEEVSPRSYIQTVWGIGFRLDPAVLSENK